MNTKENILLTALHLFASDGYEAVSVSTIAGELGMTKGALYKHYKNKQDIFDCIVERMFEIDAKRADLFEVPVDNYDSAPQQYTQTSIEHVKNFTLAQFTFWSDDEFASDFRKMLILEQYRNEKMAKLYSDCIVGGPVQYMEDIFREMIAKGIFKDGDPKQLAIEYYAPLFLLIHMVDTSLDKKDAIELLNDHIEKFMEENVRK